MKPAGLAEITTRLTGYAVIGAYAMAARGYARQTADIDLLTADGAALQAQTWAELRNEDWIVDVRIGDFEDPLRGVVRFSRGRETVDVVVSKYEWINEMIERATPVDLGGITVPVVTAADLVLLKLFAGGYLDTRDVLSLLAVHDGALVDEVERQLKGLPQEMQSLWARLRQEA
jgi:hypothetical protein